MSILIRSLVEPGGRETVKKGYEYWRRRYINIPVGLSVYLHRSALARQKNREWSLSQENVIDEQAIEQHSQTLSDMIIAWYESDLRHARTFMPEDTPVEREARIAQIIKMKYALLFHSQGTIFGVDDEFDEKLNLEKYSAIEEVLGHRSDLTGHEMRVLSNARKGVNSVNESRASRRGITPIEMLR